jgi:antitoxin (DNA-binding transcriptional repressor) of toxin-antitoxin stability system
MTELPQRINAHAARQNLAELMDRAHAGERFVLMKYGPPWAQLLPLAAPVQGQPPQRQAWRLRRLGPLDNPSVLLRP